MPSGTDVDMESSTTNGLETMTRAAAVRALLKRINSLEHLLVHKNPNSRAESERQGIEDERFAPEVLKANFRRRYNLGMDECELESIVLKHRQIIAAVNRVLNNLSRYNLEARLEILHENHQEFQIDIKTAEEYLFLLRQLEVSDDKSLAKKISIALELIAESTTMRSNIEARIQEVVEFISEGTNGSLGLVILRRMMLDLGVRHGAYGSTISLRDHDRFPQSKYTKLVDVESLKRQSNGEKIVSMKSEL